jgi:hypothetical protein
MFQRNKVGLRQRRRLLTASPQCLPVPIRIIKPHRIHPLSRLAKGIKYGQPTTGIDRTSKRAEPVAQEAPDQNQIQPVGASGINDADAVGLGVGVYLTRPKGTAVVPTVIGGNTFTTGTLYELQIPNVPPPAALTDGTWQATPNPTTLPSLNVSELLNEKK